MRFFFYGTLIAGSSNPVAQAVHARLRDLGPARIPGRLHAVADPDGCYPVLSAGKGTVRGRLYEATAEFTAADLAMLDQWEEFDPADRTGSLYLRETIGAIREDGSRTPAAVYRYNRPLPPDAEPIAGGDFIAWLLRRGFDPYGTHRG